MKSIVRFFYALLLSFLFLSLSNCFSGKDHKKIIHFFNSIGFEFPAEKHYKGILIIPLDGCKCTQYAVDYFNQSHADDGILYVCSSLSRKTITMNIKNDTNDNIIFDAKNLAVKQNIVGDFPLLFKLKDNVIVDKKEIDGTIAQTYFKSDRLKEFIN